jgi:RHS repeat-associated protein
VGELGVLQIGTDLFNMRARNYTPTTAQFASNDVLGLSGGSANLRQYVANTPTNGVDPSGRSPILVYVGIAIGVGVVVGIGFGVKWVIQNWLQPMNSNINQNNTGNGSNGGNGGMADLSRYQQENSATNGTALGPETNVFIPTNTFASPPGFNEKAQDGRGNWFVTKGNNRNRWYWTGKGWQKAPHTCPDPPPD